MFQRQVNKKEGDDMRGCNSKKIKVKQIRQEFTGSKMADKRNKYLKQFNEAGSPKDMATALLKLQPWPKVISKHLKHLISLQVIDEFICMIPKPWESLSSVDSFREAVRYCFRLADCITNEQERIASKSIIFMPRKQIF